MLISIITINYNNATGLKKTMQSVFSQSCQEMEYVVIDGGSTDGSTNYISQHSDKLTYWVSEADKGIYHAMNKGIDIAKGEFLLFLNSGDVLVDETILYKVALELNEYDIYYGNLIKINADGKKQLRTFPEKLTFKYFFNRGALPHPSTFIKRKLFTEVTYYNEDYKIASDWEFLLVAICKNNVSYKYLNFSISIFEFGGISMNPENDDLVSAEYIAILESHFPLFVEDYKNYLVFNKMFGLNRFKNLHALEESLVAQKINSIWLSIMRFIFIRK